MSDVYRWECERGIKPGDGKWENKMIFITPRDAVMSDYHVMHCEGAVNKTEPPRASVKVEGEVSNSGRAVMSCLS